MTDNINAFQSYSTLRTQINDAFDGANGEKSLAFKSGGGKGSGIYLSKQGNVGKGKDPFTSDGYRKHSDQKYRSASEQIKQSINSEFGNMRIPIMKNGTLTNVRVGDFVFEKMGNPKEITKETWNQIDGELRSALERGTEIAQDPIQKARMEQASELFKLSGNDAPSPSELKMWKRIAGPALALRTAIAQDLKQADKANGNPIKTDQEYAQKAVEIFNDIVENPNELMSEETINKVAEELRDNHDTTPTNTGNVKRLVRLDEKLAQYEGKLKVLDERLETLADGLDKTEKNALLRLRDQVSSLVREIERYVETGGLVEKEAPDPNQDPNQPTPTEKAQLAKDKLFQKDLATGFQRVSNYAHGLRLTGEGATTLAKTMRHLSDITYDFAKANFTEEQVQDLSKRPSLHGSMRGVNTLNAPSRLHSLNVDTARLLKSLNTENQAPRLLYNRLGESRQNTLDTKVEANNDQNEEVLGALETFQDSPTDQNLKVLDQEITTALAKNLDLMDSLKRAGRSVDNGAFLRANPESQGGKQVSKQMKLLVQQRDSLLRLQRMVGQANEQRNSPVELPNMHQAEKTARTERNPPPPPPPQEWKNIPSALNSEMSDTLSGLNDWLEGEDFANDAAPSLEALKQGLSAENPDYTQLLSDLDALKDVLSENDSLDTYQEEMTSLRKMITLAKGLDGVEVEEIEGTITRPNGETIDRAEIAGLWELIETKVNETDEEDAKEELKTIRDTIENGTFDFETMKSAMTEFFDYWDGHITNVAAVDIAMERLTTIFTTEDKVYTIGD